ncbi:MAG: cyclic nucleotide-binding domain-containing protein [Spirochaetes bacterium]|nr:cyclic nucleotide-binding domain-containing protein [Spirochaetota bacterium]
MIERIKKIDLFTDFSNDTERLKNVADNVRKKKFSSQELIIKEGDIGDKLYILNKGTVRILRRTLSDEKYTVALLNSDDNIFFGEVALIDSDRRSATVIAESDCEVFFIDRKNYIKLCEKDPLMGYKVTLHIAKKISSSLRKMNQDVITLFEALVAEVRGEF